MMQLTNAIMKRGFTLIELMVVIAILATLIGLGALGVSRTLRSAESTKRAAFARVVNSAISAYKNEHEEYPLDSDNVTNYGTVSNNKTDVSNVSVMMKLLGRDKNGKRNDSERAYITDTSMLYICQGNKRISKLDDVLANGSVSDSNDMIGFSITMAKSTNSKYRSMSKARAFAPIKIAFDLELDDYKVTIPGDGDFSRVINIH